MADLAIRVDGLGKRYRLGGRREAYSTLRDQIRQWAGAPARAFRRRRGAAVSDFWALKDVSFEVNRGEVVGIIGRNGAGKSTLLKILSQITEPTEGGADVHGRVGSLLEVGTGFNPELSGRENVYLNGAILGMRRAEIARKFDDIVAFAEVEKFIDTQVKHYSSGMYTRLAFAVAAHLEPEILVVDEVLAVGDAEFQKKCLGKMGEVAHGGRTVLFVSHNMAAITQLCQRCVLLKAGRVERDGPAGAVADYYQQTAVREATSGDCDLTAAPRSGGDGKVRFTRLTLLTAAGEVASRFGIGEPIRVRLQLLSELDTGHGEVGLTVRTLTDVPLFTTSSTDEREPYRIRPGAFEVEVRLDPNYLRPGAYVIQVGTTCGITRDVVPAAAQITIDDSRHYSRSFLHHLPGHLYFPYPWSGIEHGPGDEPLHAPC
jgi:lipopolysaccharide transport system ATP-binding protein